MRSAVTRSPTACVLHVLGLVALIVAVEQFQLSGYLSIALLLLLALWPWFGPWRRGDAAAAANRAATVDFSELSQSLSQHTCHNALSAAQVAHAVQQLAEKLKSQLLAVEQISQGANAITHTEQDSARRAEQTLKSAQTVRQSSADGQQALLQAIARMQRLSAQTAARSLLRHRRKSKRCCAISSPPRP